MRLRSSRLVQGLLLPSIFCDCEKICQFKAYSCRQNLAIAKLSVSSRLTPAVEILRLRSCRCVQGLLLPSKSCDCESLCQFKAYSCRNHTNMSVQISPPLARCVFLNLPASGCNARKHSSLSCPRMRHVCVSFVFLRLVLLVARCARCVMRLQHVLGADVYASRSIKELAIRLPYNSVQVELSFINELASRLERPYGLEQTYGLDPSLSALSKDTDLSRRLEP